MSNQVLNLGNVTRVVVSRANSWREDSPMFAVKFVWDQAKGREGQSLYSLYTWNTKYRQPKLQSDGAAELPMKDVVAKCKEIGLEYNKDFTSDPGKNLEITVWSNNITDKEKEMYMGTNSGKLKVQRGRNGNKDRRGSKTINWNDEETTPAVEAVEQKIEEVVEQVIETKIEKQEVKEVMVDNMDMDAVRREVEEELRRELELEVKRELEVELRRELEAEVRAEVMAEMKEAMKKQMRDEVKAKMKAEQKDSMKVEVRVTLKKEIKEGLSGGSPSVVNSEVVVGSNNKKTIVITDDEVIKTAPQVSYVATNEEYVDEYVEPVVAPKPVVTTENIVVNKTTKKTRRNSDKPVVFNDDKDESLNTNDGFSEGFNWID